MARPRSFYLATAIWVFVFVAALATFIASVTVDWHGAPQGLGPSSSTHFAAITVLTMSSVGWLLAVRRPGNLVGWIMLTVAVTGATIDSPNLYATYAIYIHPGSLPGATWVYWLGQIPWILLLGQLLVLLPMVFPDGRLLSNRWLIPIGLFGVLALLIFAVSFDPTATAPIPNPVGLRQLAGVSQFLSTAPFALAFLAVCSSGVVSLGVRYRRGTELEREQLKWLLAAVAVLLVALGTEFATPVLNNSAILPLAATLLPIAIGIAVLRYRLYDIDLIINKALVYGGLAAVITAAYVVVVIGIGALVGTSRELPLSIVATLLIAISFQPLRQRTQRLANRLVYGKRSTPYETLSEFSENLSETFSQEDILDRMARLLAQGTGAEQAEVWVRAGTRLLRASASPPTSVSAVAEMAMENGSLPRLERDLVVPVSHQGEVLGALTVMKKRGDAMRPVEQKLLSDLAAQAGLVLRNVRLNRDLLARLDELRASRQRLVTAQDEERRRLERNLHDGAQQHLVALKLKLGVAESLSEPSSRARPILSQLKGDAQEAIDNLRELARGIYPPLLASEGLGAVLKAQARRVAFSLEVSVDDLPRFPKETESAVYFCCLEALQNISKYAVAKRASVHLWTDGGHLRFTVEDDGKGFDPSTLRQTSGLQNMRDRIESLGGTVTVTSQPGQGTKVAGELPVQVGPDHNLALRRSDAEGA
jgi:signal transduction histidine kinase